MCEVAEVIGSHRGMRNSVFLRRDSETARHRGKFVVLSLHIAGTSGVDPHALYLTPPAVLDLPTLRIRVVRLN